MCGACVSVSAGTTITSSSSYRTTNEKQTGYSSVSFFSRKNSKSDLLSIVYNQGANGFKYWYQGAAVANRDFGNARGARVGSNRKTEMDRYQFTYDGDAIVINFLVGDQNVARRVDRQRAIVARGEE